ncbi:hypothetical protein V2J09_008949 [Rumex salicifolius]
MRVNELTSLGGIDDGTTPAIALEDEDEESWINIPDQFLINPKENPIQQLVDEVYPKFNQNKHDPTYIQERAILTPLNQDVDQVNAYMFEILQGVEKLYK